MCRRNQGWAYILLGMGAGMMVGLVIASHFLCFCIGLAAVCGGAAMLMGRR